MKYLCQLDYPHIPYPTRMTEDPPALHTTVKSSGCGLCSACMVADMLTDKVFTIEEAVAMSVEAGANPHAGTNMPIFGPVFAERFGLTMAMSNDLDEAIAHLQKGGKIIAHMGIPEGATIGLFTKGGHYVVLVDTDGEQFTVLDPSYDTGKFDIPERKGRVDDSNAPFLRCPVKTLDSETKPGKTKYYLFARKQN